MPLALTSDFPSSLNDGVLQRIRQAGQDPRVAWVPPLTSLGRQKFHAARAVFESLGVSRLEFWDIDEEPQNSQIANLDQYDVVYFTGGDPLVFRQNIQRSGVSASITRCLAARRLIVAASGGAMQFAANLSLYRLLSHPLEEVTSAHNRHLGLGVVPYEFLPHLNRLEPAFIDMVRRYSETVSCDVVALEDGTAMIHEDDGSVFCVGGMGVRFRGGVRSHIGA